MVSSMTWGLYWNYSFMQLGWPADSLSACNWWYAKICFYDQTWGAGWALNSLSESYPTAVHLPLWGAGLSFSKRNPPAREKKGGGGEGRTEWMEETVVPSRQMPLVTHLKDEEVKKKMQIGAEAWMEELGRRGEKEGGRKGGSCRLLQQV